MYSAVHDLRSVRESPIRSVERIRVRNEETFDYSLNVAKNLLKIIGAWPLESNASILERLIKYLLNLICFLLLIFFFVPSVLYIVLLSRSLRIKLKIAATTFTCFANAAKYVLLLKQSDRLKACLRRAKEDWQVVTLDEDYESMISRGKLGRTLATLSTCLIYGGSMSYRTILPLAKGKMIVNNVTIRPLACPSYYIVFDEQKSPAYELVFIGHFFSGFVVYSVASAVCALTTFFVLHACGQLEILIRKMRDIETVSCDEEKNVDKRVVEIVLHQNKTRRQVVIITSICSFIKEVVDFVTYMALAEIASCMFLICIVLYSFIMEYNSVAGIITYSMLLMSFTYNLFILCYVGELLADQHLKVIETSSTLDWNYLSPKSARSLILVILMSNNPSKLAAGKIMDLSLSNFASMFKTAVGYFNILRTTAS